jgi:serine protease Do
MMPFGEQDPMRDFFEKFFQFPMPKEFKQKSLGSGFIIDKDGFILTNNHVVEKTKEIEVTLKDDRTFEAEIVGRDPKTDLALIRIDADDTLTPLIFGDSEGLRVGDWVLAIGSPFGLGHTVTAGIVSAKFRKIGAEVYEDFIQTDASINPGNSGGPLLNVKGEVIGINTAIFSQSGGNIGIGFAIPINMAKDLLPQLREGKIIRGWLGVMIQEITPAIKDKLDLETDEGALVSDVTKDSPADEAGIKRGDVIVSFDGRKIKDMQDLPMIVASTPVGKEVSVEVLRKGKNKDFRVKIRKLEEEEATSAAGASEQEPELGMTVREITPELAQNYQLAQTDGLVVVRVETSSPAADAGVRPGDIILEIDQERVTDLEEFQRKIDTFGKGDTILLLIRRQKANLFLTIDVGD